jgi:hypothetical protein
MANRDPFRPDAWTKYSVEARPDHLVTSALINEALRILGRPKEHARALRQKLYRLERAGLVRPSHLVRPLRPLDDRPGRPEKAWPADTLEALTT